MPGETLGDLSAALEAAVARAAESTVLVDARRRFGASGIVWEPDLVVTAAHVIERSSDIRVAYPGGSSQPAELAGADAGIDVAVLQVAAGGGTVPQFVEAPEVGTLALTMGRPSAQGVSASLGIVSAIAGQWRTRTGALVEGYPRSDAQMLSGFSGGPLVSTRGAVLEMNTSFLSRDGGLTIPHANLLTVQAGLPLTSREAPAGRCT